MMLGGLNVTCLNDFTPLVMLYISSYVITLTFLCFNYNGNRQQNKNLLMFPKDSNYQPEHKKKLLALLSKHFTLIKLDAKMFLFDFWVDDVEKLVKVVLIEEKILML